MAPLPGAAKGLYVRPVMTGRDFALLSVICLAWGINLIFTRIVVLEVPPLFYTFVRFACVAVVLSPFLRRIPKQWGWATLIGLCIGSLNFGLMFAAAKYATASSVAVAGQVVLPMSTLLSILFLKEQISVRRGAGMLLAFCGTIYIAYDPST
ncbi:MAG: DMT family transporter, partial [Hyphomonadaceae bacterium]